MLYWVLIVVSISPVGLEVVVSDKLFHSKGGCKSALSLTIAPLPKEAILLANCVPTSPGMDI